MSRPVVLVVEHEAQCPLAHLGAWLADAGCALEVCRPYRGDALPDPTSYDGLLVLGGSPGVGDDVPWLEPVQEMVRKAAGSGLPTLGVCLGHQLAAAALGGSVARNPRGQTLGVLALGWTDAAADDELFAGLATPRRGVFWNHDVVTTQPPGAQVLARSVDGEPQAVRFAPSVWGVQLHPEADRAVVASWAEGDRDEHDALGVDQERLLADVDAAREELDAAWRPLADRFAELVAR